MILENAQQKYVSLILTNGEEVIGKMMTYNMRDNEVLLSHAYKVKIIQVDVQNDKGETEKQSRAALNPCFNSVFPHNTVGFVLDNITAYCVIEDEELGKNPLVNNYLTYSGQKPQEPEKTVEVKEGDIPKK